MSPATCSAFPAPRCSKPSSRGPRRPPRSPIWPEGGCARSWCSSSWPCHGSLSDDHRFMLDQLLRSLQEEDQRIAATEDRIATKLDPYRQQQLLLMTIPGVDWAVAATMIAEHGVDMARFGT